jgi:hypothetical protein
MMRSPLRPSGCLEADIVKNDGGTGLTRSDLPDFVDDDVDLFVFRVLLSSLDSLDSLFSAIHEQEGSSK